MSHHVPEPFELKEGRDFYMVLDFNGLDVSLNTYSAEVRTKVASGTGVLLATMTVSAAYAGTGFITLSISGSVITAALVDRFNGAVFDVKEITPGLPLGDDLMDGSFVCTKKVTA